LSCGKSNVLFVFIKSEKKKKKGKEEQTKQKLFIKI